MTSGTIIIKEVQFMRIITKSVFKLNAKTLKLGSFRENMILYKTGTGKCVSQSLEQFVNTRKSYTTQSKGIILLETQYNDEWMLGFR